MSEIQETPSGVGVDARAAFECARDGHVPLIELRQCIFVESFVMPCERCSRVVEFKSRPIISIGGAA